MFIFKFLITTAAVLSSNLVWGLQLQPVTSGKGRESVIKANGLANISWITEEGDPSHITLELQNKDTLDSFEIAKNVDISLGSLIWHVDSDVPGSWRSSYYVEAVEVRNLQHVYATSPLFRVQGRLPWPTQWPPCDTEPVQTEGTTCWTGFAERGYWGTKLLLVVLLPSVIMFSVLRRIRRRRRLEERACQLPLSADDVIVVSAKNHF